jgi:8-oxo-dGTP diphosphatase
MNPFESGHRKVIPAVLVYAERDGRILMIHRNSKPNDYHEGKWNGLGGKCELDESPLEAARRELEEESGLVLPESAFRALGTLQFPNFKPHKNEDWLVFVFTAQVPGAMDPMTASQEGALSWIARDEVLNLNLWPGDRRFIPHVLEGKPFMGTIWYSGQDVARSWIAPL